MEQQGAQERHGCRRPLSADVALRASALRSRGSHRGTVDCVAPGPASSPASEDTSAGLPAQCRDPSAPPHPLRSGAPVRVCARVRAHVSPARICDCFQGLSVSERPLKFSLTFPLFLSGRGTSPGLLDLCRRPLPRSATPGLPILCLGALAGLRDFLSGAGRACDQTGEGL